MVKKGCHGRCPTGKQGSRFGGFGSTDSSNQQTGGSTDPVVERMYGCGGGGEGRADGRLDSALGVAMIHD